MAEEYRSSVYWGAGAEGKWFKANIAAQTQTDVRFEGSLMNFVRYAVRYCLENDPTLKRRKLTGAKSS